MELQAALAASISANEVRHRYGRSFIDDRTIGPRKQAEAYLKKAQVEEGFLLAALEVISGSSSNPGVQQAAAVAFKNHVKAYWCPRDSDSAEHIVPAGEKEETRKHILRLMLNSPPLVQAQLSEALTLLSEVDFPRQWPDLLPQLAAQLRENASNHLALRGALMSANSIFKRFRRGEVLAGDLNSELRLCQEAFGRPLLEIARAVTAQVEASPGAAREQLEFPLQCARLAFRIWYSLNYFGLSEMEFEMLPEFMRIFVFYLGYENPALADIDPETAGPLDHVKTAVCSNINLLMLKEEDDWADQYLEEALTAVWRLLVSVSRRPGQDALAMEAIRFLVTVARSGHHSLFREGEVMRQIIESIVIPNLMLREEDEENFEMNFVEYVRRDSEGSDSDTRRRLACELVKALVDNFPNEITDMCSAYVASMLREYSANPSAHWKSKDCAIYLLTALAVRGTTQAQGATKTNDRINICEFFTSHVARDIEAEAPSPILTADALRFVTTFRMTLPKQVLQPVLPHVIKLLLSDSNVVHSYAATLMERVMAMHEDGRQRFTPQDMAPFLQPLLDNLFKALEQPDSEENEYVMKCIMRVVVFLREAVAPVATVFLEMLSKLLLVSCANPRNPAFSHFMFESIAGILRHTLPSRPELAGTFEGLLFPAIDVVLQKDIQEYAPYAFQVVALLLELRPLPAPPVYVQLLPPLLTPHLWEDQGNIPALVRLLRAYMRRLAGEVVSNGHLLPLLGVFQKLNSTRAFDHGGFGILEALVQHLDLAVYKPYLSIVFSLIFTRLQSSRTKKYVRFFNVFLARMIVKIGVKETLAEIDAVQQGLSVMVLQSVFGPNLVCIYGASEETAIVTASVRLLSSLLKWPQEQGAWSAVLKGTVVMLGRQQEAFRLPTKEAEMDEMAQGYSAQFAQLANAMPMAEEPELAHEGLCGMLGRAMTELCKGRQELAEAVSATLSQEEAQKLQDWMKGAGA